MMETMSRNQQMTLGVLGTAIVVVYGCLGAYALIHLTQGGLAETTASGRTAGVAPPEPGLAAGSATTDTLTPSPQTPPGALPTNTRVIPLDGGTAVSATPLPTSGAGASPTPPVHASQTVEQTPPVPQPPPPSPVPDTSCAERENAYHQQQLADIDAQYEPMLTWFEDEMKQAERDRDYTRLEEVRREYETYQEIKAADVRAESERHEAALVACQA